MDFNWDFAYDACSGEQGSFPGPWGYSPNSMNNPSEDEQPGPPFVQKITSSLSGSLLLSKK